MTNTEENSDRKREVRICIFDPSNRTVYTGGKLMDDMYTKCATSDITVSCDEYAIAYHHWPSMNNVSLDDVTKYIQKTEQPDKAVRPYVPGNQLPSADQVVDFIIKNYDVLLIGGSDDSATDDNLPYIPLLHKVLDKLINVHDLPINAYCFGAQLVARVMNGDESTQDLEEVSGEKGEYGFVRFKIQTVDGERIPLFDGIPIEDEGIVSTALHDECFVVHHSEVLLKSDNAPQSAFKVKGKRTFCFQFHLDYPKEEGEKFFAAQMKEEPETRIIRDADGPELDKSMSIIRNFYKHYVLKD
ncbi:GMP synthase [Acrasis kona]|uniref:GMP synthase n=1 Tax=Acrasis kona TaxID=1008807 RepID=A0AAW2Z0W6_9EUKA